MQLHRVDLKRVFERQSPQSTSSSVQLGSLGMLGLALFIWSGGNLYHFYLVHEHYKTNVTDLRRLEMHIASAPLPPETLREMVMVSQQMTQDWSGSTSMLKVLGRLNSDFNFIKLARIDWCWHDNEERCADDFAAKPRTVFPPEALDDFRVLRVRLEGELVGEFNNLRDEYNHYQQWVESIVSDERFTLMRHIDMPHQSAHALRATGERPGRFSIDLAYQWDRPPVSAADRMK